MSLSDFAARLEEFGFPLRAAEDADDTKHPAIGAQRYPVLAVRAPAGQGAMLLDADGSDPTFGIRAAPAGGRLRRLLALMKEDGLIVAWASFQEAGFVWVHIQFTARGARAFFRRVDWQAKTAVTSDERTSHSFL